MAPVRPPAVSHPLPLSAYRQPVPSRYPGFLVKPQAQPLLDEPVIYKSVNSAFIGVDLEQRLRNAGISTAVKFGITTDHCVSTTTRMAGNLGFDTYVVSDTTATFERPGPDGRHCSAAADARCRTG